MKTFLRSRDGASKGAALMIVLAFVVLLAGVALAYFSRTTTDRQLAQSSYHDTSADLLARSALDVIVGGLKREIVNGGAVTRSNIQPQRSGDDASIPNLVRRSVRNDSIPAPGMSSLASAVNSGPADPSNVKRGEIASGRWNSHYLIPRFNPANTAIDSTPVSTFTAPDWVLVTRNGPSAFSGWDNSLKDPTPTNNNYVVGRYGFAIYDEGGLLDMNLAGYPSWPDGPFCASPAPTPWLLNVGRKGIVTFGDLTALGPDATQIDNIVGWRNYATTQRTGATFPNFSPFAADCGKQNNYGSYLLYFGDPPFTIESLADKLAASVYPFTSVATQLDTSNTRTDQALTSRQQLLKLLRSLDSSGNWQNWLRYMGTFSRERNRPAPDWPHLNDPGETSALSEGRFNMNNLALIIPNPAECNIAHGKKKGWQTGKNRNHLCGTPTEIIELFGLFWVKADAIDTNYKTPGHWTYIQNTGPNPPGDPDPNPKSIICFRGANQQNDFFQILHYALNVARPGSADRCAGHGQKNRTFAVGASLIDQYDSGADCLTTAPSSWGDTGCDLDSHVVTHNGGNQKYATHTTVIRYGQGGGGTTFAFGMEPTNLDNSQTANGDCPAGETGHGCSQQPHRPCTGDNQFPCAPPNEPPAPTPAAATQVISHAFSNVGEFGYGIDTSATGVPPLDFSPPGFYDAPLLDFFSYNPISSAYPRAGIVNLYTRNAPVLAAMLKSALKNDTSTSPPSSIVVSPAEATSAANAIVCETQWVLTGTSPPGCPSTPLGWPWTVTQTDLTRAIAARLSERGGTAAGWSSNEQKQSIARALAEVGQTRTWNLLIDVIAQTGHYSPNAQGLSDFIPEGEKRYWLHVALGRDLVQADGTPCAPGVSTGCQVDVLGTQLEEVIE